MSIMVFSSEVTVFNSAKVGSNSSDLTRFELDDWLAALFTQELSENVPVALLVVVTVLPPLVGIEMSHEFSYCDLSSNGSSLRRLVILPLQEVSLKLCMSFFSCSYMYREFGLDANIVLSIILTSPLTVWSYSGPLEWSPLKKSMSPLGYKQNQTKVHW